MHSMKFYLVIDLILQHRIALQIKILKELFVHCVCCSTAPVCIAGLKNKPGLVLAYCVYYFYSIYLP